MFNRDVFKTLQQRLAEKRRFIQVLAGPRQVGKTTVAQQVIKQWSNPAHFSSADAIGSGDTAWIMQQWETARLRIRSAGAKEGLLILDEVQKVPQWSETVKRCWDEDTAQGLSLKVVLLGSSPLLVQRGLTESLAGRFETLPMTHWSYQEMKEAFNTSLEQYIFFGGYPGAYDLISNESRWRQYILDSLIETTISRDILLMTQVNKPALLRQIFYMSCQYSGQILSYQKMVRQMQDAGNTTTLAHYLELLAGAGMVAGIPKYAGQQVRQRASSPKLQVMNMALMSALSQKGFKEIHEAPDLWGRWTESAVGAYLYNASLKYHFKLFYWRERSKEVDFVIQHQGRLIALEVKSHYRKTALPGMVAFENAFHPDKHLLVGGDCLSIEEFLSMPVDVWLNNE